MKIQKTTFAVLALVVANICWGLNTPLLKMGVQSIPVPIFTATRFLFTALVMLPFALKGWKRLSRRDTLVLSLSSFFYITLSGPLLNYGLEKTSVSNVAIIDLIGPLLLLVLSVFFLRERLSLQMFIGITIAMVGALIISSKPMHGSNLFGNLLVIVSVFCNVFSTLLCKPIAHKMGAYQLTFMSIFPGVLPLVALAVIELPHWNINMTTARSWYGMIGSCFMILSANFLYFWALQRKHANETGVYLYIQPVVALLGAWIWFHEQPQVAFLLGAILVAYGVYIGQFLRRKIAVPSASTHAEPEQLY